MWQCLYRDLGACRVVSGFCVFWPKSNHFFFFFLKNQYGCCVYFIRSNNQIKASFISTMGRNILRLLHSRYEIIATFHLQIIQRECSMLVALTYHFAHNPVISNGIHSIESNWIGYIYMMNDVLPIVNSIHDSLNDFRCIHSYIKCVAIFSPFCAKCIVITIIRLAHGKISSALFDWIFILIDS